MYLCQDLEQPISENDKSKEEMGGGGKHPSTVLSLLTLHSLSTRGHSVTSLFATNKTTSCSKQSGKVYLKCK